MKFTIQREELLKPLQMVLGAVERRQTLPILGNVLMVVNSHQLALTATDLEVELVGRVTLNDPADAGTITVPARKLMDICRNLSDQSILDINLDGEKFTIKAGRSRFSLSTLSADDFPNLEDAPGELEFSIKNKELSHLLHCTYFSMAQQDVRYYLNGMLLEIENDLLRSVATDGHRLAVSTVKLATNSTEQQFIIPRKGVVELMRLLDDSDDDVAVTITKNHIRVSAKDFTFTSKLIDGRFPDYQRVIPKGGDKQIIFDKDYLKQALTRVSILSNEKYRGVRVSLSNGLLSLAANNPDQEEAEEQLEVDYMGEDLEIGFNVSYILDVLSSIPTGEVRMTLSNPDSSLLLESLADEKSSYVVMPMRL